MKIISKQTLMHAGGLGVGNVAAKFVKGKFLASQGDIVKNAVPAVAGIFLSAQNGVIGSVGDGMIAEGIGGLLAKVAGLAGIDGLGDTDVMLGEVPVEESPLMGTDDFGTADYNSFGEMNY